ncbi:MAG: pilin [Candidatus Altiarchaeia archaeon]
MEKKHLPVLIGLFLCITVPVYAQNYFAARDLFNNIACNVICVIEYIILAVCAVTCVLSGARYMASDEPSVRGDMRKNFIYAVVGLFLVFAGIPALNAFVNQTRSPFYCISCSPDSYLFKIVTETLSCRIICLVQYIAGLLLVLILVFAGLRYIVSGEDPKARHDMLTLIKNALIGMLIVILAVPVLNYLADGTGTSFECECSSSGDEIIASVEGLSTDAWVGKADKYEEGVLGQSNYDHLNKIPGVEH